MAVITLAEAIAAVSSGLEDADRASGTYADDPSGFHRRRNHEMQALADRLANDVNARITGSSSDARVRICGITSTSTCGISGALHNWLRAAEKRLEGTN